jgi:hypothetical protein
MIWVLSNWIDEPIGPATVPPIQPFEQPRPNRPAEFEPIYRPGGGGFLEGFLFAAIVGLAVAFWFTRGADPNPDDGDAIDVAGLKVLILEETGERENLAPGQIAAINSVQVREAITARDGELRVLDVDDKTDKLAEPWPTLRRRVTLRPPVVILAEKRRAVEFALPADPEALVKRIEAFK